MRKSHGIIASCWIMLQILVSLASAYFFFGNPILAATVYPTLPKWALQIYGCYAVAGGILLVYVFFMRKWAFYAYVLLCLFGTYYDVENLQLSWSEAAYNHAFSPIILFLVLMWTGSWIAMDAPD